MQSPSFAIQGLTKMYKDLSIAALVISNSIWEAQLSGKTHPVAASLRVK
jgi:hypothetical protein